MQKLLIIISLITINSNIILHSQVISEMEKEFKNVIQQVEEYYSQFPDSVKKPGWKQFKRQEYFLQGRVGGQHKGDYEINLFDSIYVYNGKEYENHIQDGVPLWQATGPHIIPSASQNRYGIGRLNVARVHPQRPNEIWVGAAAGGAWKSTNNGDTWTLLPTTEFLSGSISDIKFAPSNPDIIYIATGDMNGAAAVMMDPYSIGLIKSTDGGQSWKTTALSAILSERFLIGKIQILPSNPDIVVVTTSRGIYRTTNGGDTFTQINTIPSRDLEMHPTNENIMYFASYNRTSNAGIYKSTDAGQTWVGIVNISGSNRLELAVTPASPNNVYAVVSATNNSYHSFWTSNDEGSSFRSVNVRSNGNNYLGSGNGSDNSGQGWYDLAIAVSPNDPHDIYIGGVNVWRSTNGGSSFRMIGHWYGGFGVPELHADQHEYMFSRDGNTLYIANDGGFYPHKVDSEEFPNKSTGMNITQYYNIGANNMNNNLIGGTQDNGTFLRRNGTWTHVIGGDGMDCGFHPTDQQIMYGSIYFGRFSRSTNGGQSFSQIFSSNILSSRYDESETGAWVTPLCQDPIEPNTIYVGMNNVWMNKSNGDVESWERISNFGTTNTLVDIAVAPMDNKIKYAAFSGVVYKTTDNGNSWAVVFASRQTISAIVISTENPHHLYVSNRGFGPEDKVFLVTPDETINLSGNLANVPVNAIAFQKESNDRLFIGTDLGVYFSDNNSGNWERYGALMPFVIVEDLHIRESDNKLIAGTYGRGMWEVLMPECISGTLDINLTGSMEVCPNDSVRLEVISNTDNFVWNTGSTERVIYVSQPGTYSISEKGSEICRARSKTFELKNKNIPELGITVFGGGSNFVICEGEDITLNATLGFQQYRWSNGQETRRLTLDKPGKYFVEAVIDDNCKAVSQEIEIVVVPKPEKPLIERKDDTTLIAVSEHGRFQWYFNGAILPNQRSREMKLNSEMVGIFTVEVTDPNGCSNISDEFGVIKVSVESFDFDEIGLMPNPAIDRIKLKGLEYLPSKITIVNSLGIEVKILENINSRTISVSDLQNGTYFVKLNFGKTEIVKRLIIAR